MVWHSLAMVTVDFPRHKLSDADVQELERVLRQESNIDNLVIHVKQITFFLWGQASVEYAVLDRLRQELERKQCRDFVIDAREYAETGHDYHHVSR